jgi:UDP-N-acetylglucosamine 2-epimerase (non-hydrolysing)
MPEEINRLMTDQVAELLFTPSVDGDENLLKEGIAPERIHFVGNVMIDTLVRLLPKAEAGDTLARLKLPAKNYGLVTLHRPSNVDDPDMLPHIIDTLLEIGQELPLVFPIHPRTRQRIAQQGISLEGTGLRLLDPLGYLDFLALQRHAKLILTDSGGIQEESTYLGTPCLTVRENTERPITITQGTNVLVGQDMAKLKAETAKIMAGNFKQATVPDLWDGKAGERIAGIMATYAG